MTLKQLARRRHSEPLGVGHFGKVWLVKVALNNEAAGASGRAGTSGAADASGAAGLTINRREEDTDQLQQMLFNS